MNEVEVAVVEVPEVVVTTSPEAAVEVEVKGKKPSEVEFSLAWNRSNTRAEVLADLHKDGFHMTYSALVARYTSYKEKGANLKELTPGKRGRKTNIEAVNAALAEQAAAAVISA